MSDISEQLPDLPIVKADFRKSALAQGYEARVGGRLFGDAYLRGWLYTAARARHDGRDLSIRDETRLGDQPEAILGIYYFGDDSFPEALSLNGVRRAVAMSFNHELDYLGRGLPFANAAILADVLATKAMLQQTIHYDVE